MSLTGRQSLAPLLQTYYPPPPQGKAPHPANSPISQISCPTWPAQPSLFQLPANLRNHSNKPITSSQGNQGSAHPLFYYKAHPPQLLLAHSVPECNPHVALWPAMSSSGLCVWLTLPAIWAHPSRVRCLAFSYLYYLGQSSSLNNLANRASRRHPLPFPSIIFWCWWSDFPLGTPTPQHRPCGSGRTGSGHNSDLAS